MKEAGKKMVRLVDEIIDEMLPYIVGKEGVVQWVQTKQNEIAGNVPFKLVNEILFRVLVSALYTVLYRQDLDRKGCDARICCFVNKYKMNEVFSVDEEFVNKVLRIEYHAVMNLKASQTLELATFIKDNIKLNEITEASIKSLVGDISSEYLARGSFSLLALSDSEKKEAFDEGIKQALSEQFNSLLQFE